MEKEAEGDRERGRERERGGREGVERWKEGEREREAEGDRERGEPTTLRSGMRWVKTL